MKVLMASKNLGKIEGAKKAFECYFNDVEIIGLDIDSEVAEQPINREILKGAKNRIKNLKKYAIDNKIQYNFLLSTEAGITDLLGEWYNINIAVIEDKEGYQSSGTSSAFPIPEKYVEEIKNTNLGSLMDKIFNGKDLGKKEGGINNLTKGEISRIKLTKEAFIMALTRHINGEVWR